MRAQYERELPVVHPVAGRASLRDRNLLRPDYELALHRESARGPRYDHAYDETAVSSKVLSHGLVHVRDALPPSKQGRLRHRNRDAMEMQPFASRARDKRVTTEREANG